MKTTLHSIQRILLESKKRKDHSGQQTFDYAKFLKVDKSAANQIKTYTKTGSPEPIRNPVQNRRLGLQFGYPKKVPVDHPKRRKTDESMSIYKQITHLINEMHVKKAERKAKALHKKLPPASDTSAPASLSRLQYRKSLSDVEDLS